MSTGIGFGIGIPHASTRPDLRSGRRAGPLEGGRQFRRARQPAGEARHAFSRAQGQFQKHLHTLANIAKFLHKPDFRSALEEFPRRDAMLNIIKEYGKSSFVFPVHFEFTLHVSRFTPYCLPCMIRKT